jgi:ectoine hydroxylase-related dioxygenase (phytanoyl-CoA dioxygenase family)
VITELSVPWVESPFFESILRKKRLSPEDKRRARQYHEHGYTVLEGLLSEAEAQQIVCEVAPVYSTSSTGAQNRHRAQDAWQKSPAVARLAAHPRVLDVLRLLYGREPFPFQTLNFPRGSQQAGHSDQIHFSALPARFMCGVWVALEDVAEDNGPLFYYPGSHALPEYDLYDLGLSAEPPDYAAYERAIAALMEERGFKREELRVKTGTALVWSSNIVHGGMPIAREGATRHSQVTHYYFDGCIYYTPMFSNRTVGAYELREHVIDIRTGAEVKQSWNGRPYLTRPTRSRRKRIELTDEPRIGLLESKARRLAEADGVLGRAIRKCWQLIKILRRGSKPPG